MTRGNLMSWLRTRVSRYWLIRKHLCMLSGRGWILLMIPWSKHLLSFLFFFPSKCRRPIIVWTSACCAGQSLYSLIQTQRGIVVVVNPSWRQQIAVKVLVNLVVVHSISFLQGTGGITKLLPSHLLQLFRWMAQKSLCRFICWDENARVNFVTVDVAAKFFCLIYINNDGGILSKECVVVQKAVNSNNLLENLSLNCSDLDVVHPASLNFWRFCCETQFCVLYIQLFAQIYFRNSDLLFVMQFIILSLHDH